MTSYERYAKALARKPVDMLAAVISPWVATVERWKRELIVSQPHPILL